MTEVRSVEDIFKALDPKLLREEFELPYARWREDFRPNLETTDASAIEDEAKRFLTQITAGEWGLSDPADAAFWAPRAWHEVTTAFGGVDKARRIAYEHGMPALLDAIVRHKQLQSLEWHIFYMERSLFKLDTEAQLKISKAYVQSFQKLFPNAQLESPVSIIFEWKETLLRHAKQVLGWN